MNQRNYQEEVNKIFEEMGVMSNAYLMRKYRITARACHLLMKPLASGCWLVLKNKGIISKIIRDDLLTNIV